MTRPVPVFAHLIALVIWVFCALVASTARSAEHCNTLLTDPGVTGSPKEIALIQLGTRTKLQDKSGLLQDGRIGAYTRQALVRLCGQVPLPAETDPVHGTLDLAIDYGTIATGDPDWVSKATSPALKTRLTAPSQNGVNAVAVRLAGPPQLTLDTLQNTLAQGTACQSFTSDDLSEPALAGLDALIAAGPDSWSDPKALCTALATKSDSADNKGFENTLTSYAAIEVALPGALSQLLAPDFSAWLVEEQDTRVPRLAGSDAAVIALIAEYRAADRPAAPRDYSGLFASLPTSCAEPKSTNVLEYSAFDQSDLDNLVQPVDVAGALSGLAGKTFDSSDALMAAITTALAGQVSQCTLDQIGLAVFSSEDLGLRYSLDPEGTANLALVDGFSESADVVTPLIGLTAQTRGALLSGVRIAILKDAQISINAEVALAAETLAAASEELASTLDTRPQDVPEFPELPVATPIGVTEATDSAVTATVTDPDFRKALLDAQYAPAPNTEVLKGDVRRILAPIAANKVDTIVSGAMSQVQKVVDRNWQLTSDLNQAILSAPAVSVAQSLDLTAEDADALKSLVGVEYPNERLLASAIAAVSPAPPDAVAAQARLAGLRNAPDPTAPRYATDLALPDCKCTAARRENAEVYAFYPFWLLPKLALPGDDPAQDADETSESAEDGTDEKADTPEPLHQVDFGLVSRIAFYGLEFAYGNPEAAADERIIRLDHQARWIEARRDFVNAAHLHRAKADLAITLTGWDQWSSTEIETVADKIVDLSAPFSRVKDGGFRGFIAAFPTIFDAPRPDGVTLIFRGYTGVDGQGESALKLRTMVARVAAKLKDRGQSVNLGLDLELTGIASDSGLMSDLRSILVDASQLPTPNAAGGTTATSASRSSSDTPPPVDKILVFMERPTTNTKKLMRARMERGDYKGVERTEVLRRILPVVPPGGHRDVLQNSRAVDASTATTEEFSQFYDDIVYFQDNFAGIGFWPAPDPVNPDMPQMQAIMDNLLILPGIPSVLAPFEQDIARACTWICPNRAYLGTAAALLALLTGLIIWRSFYSGLADAIAFRLGAVWIGTGAVAAILAALTLCDPAAVIAPVAFVALILGLLLLLGFTGYQRARNGPKP